MRPLFDLLCREVIAGSAILQGDGTPITVLAPGIVTEAMASGGSTRSVEDIFTQTKDIARARDSLHEWLLAVTAGGRRGLESCFTILANN